jgi:hypothetical protein
MKAANGDFTKADTVARFGVHANKKALAKWELGWLARAWVAAFPKAV